MVDRLTSFYLTLTAVTLLGPSIVSALDEENHFVAHSRSIFSGSLNLKSEEAAIIARGEPADGFSFSLQADRLLIHEHHFSRLILAPRLPYAYETTGAPRNVSYGAWWANSSTVALKESQAQAAFAVYAQEVQLHGSSVTLLDVADDPYLRTPSPKPAYGVKNLDDELGSSSLSGRFLRAELGATRATFTGAMSLYWFNHTITVVGHGGETSELKSHTWDEHPSPHVIVRHVRWYEAAVFGKANLEQFNGQSNAIWFLPRIRIENASSLVADSAKFVAGSLPANGTPNGDSLWLNGTFDAEAKPGKENDSRHYSVRVTGAFDAVGIGGGIPLHLTKEQSVVVLAGLLGLLVFLLRAGESFLCGIASLYTKLKKDQILDVPSRDTLYRLIQQTPGINFLALHKQVKNLEGTRPIAFGALAYHLSQMERFQLIVSKREGRYRRYFDVAANMGADTARIALLQTQPVPAIALAVLQSPRLNQAGLYARMGPALGITRQALAYHLKRLESKDLIRREEEGRFIRYVPTERLARLSRFLEGASNSSAVSSAPADGIAT